LSGAVEWDTGCCCFFGHAKISGMGRPLSQQELIGTYKRVYALSRDSDNAVLWTHCQHVLFGLGKIIESFGPTPEYDAWLAQFSPSNLADKHTFTIDL